MVNIITGSIALCATIAFLVLYLSRIDSAPFWIITISVLALAATDVVQAIRNDRRGAVAGTEVPDA